MATGSRTAIYKRTADGGEHAVGFVTPDGAIWRQWDLAVAAGRWTADGRVLRRTAHDERELGSFTAAGRIRSHGLFAGGDLGWVEPDGTVVQAGLILGEEEVGRVDGPNQTPAAAALLLLFLPDDAEENRRLSQRR
jgi:hypothetical protein